MSFFDQEMESMLEVYLLETSQLLEQLDAILLHAEKAGLLTQEEINGVFRVMHTTKSSSAMMGLHDLSELAHKLEDLFAVFREDAGKLQGVEKDVFDLVFEASDFIRAELAAMQNEGYQPQRASALLLQIGLVTQKLGSGSRVVVRLRFEKDCKMENVRAFMVARQVRQLCTDMRLYPEDVEKNPETADYIRKNGFYISFIAEDREQVLDLLRGALFVEECRVVDEIPVKEQEPEPEAQGHAEPGSQYISVRVERLDELQNLTGELLIAASAVGDGGAGQAALSDGAVHQLDQLLSELEGIVISIRMIPFSGIAPKLNRIVRDMCKKEKKEVAFVMTGQEVEVDKNIVDSIFDPLMHLLRNAIDHGIEPPETREGLGKKRAGRVAIHFESHGGEVLCTVSDDGRGIDTDLVCKKARQKGLLTQPEERYTRQELLETCFLPGFSTRESATEFSGRGVGLDVVKAMIERFGGHLGIESEKGAGTCITMHLPLSLTIIDCFKFEAGGQIFAVPAYQVEQFFPFDPSSPCYRVQDGRGHWIFEERCQQVLSLCEFYGLERRENARKQLICVRGATRSACMLADHVIGRQSLVDKPLPGLFGPRFKQKTGIAGSSILGDGTICALLDVEDLIKSALEGRGE